MRRALLGACLTFAGCAAIHPDGTSNCLISVAGDVDDRLAISPLTQVELDKQVNKALDAATFTTDWRLNDPLTNCSALVGYRVYTKRTGNWLRPDGLRISGETSCWSKMITVGSGGPKDWNYSAIVHELFHAMQHCESPPPTDPGYDDDHSNWYRDGIFSAIDYERSQP